MAWKITKDLINEDTDCCEEGNGSGNIFAELPHKFRLKDDDGDVYFLGQSSDNSSEAAFNPLDWATVRYGCTSIEYKNTSGEWETL